MRIQLPHILLAALLTSSALCLHFPLMSFYRKTFSAKYPEIAQTWPNDGDFAVLGSRYPPFVTEEIVYAGRVQETLRHGIPHDPFIKENRSSPTFVNDLITYEALALLTRLTGDMQTTWSVVRFLCGAAWFLLLYFLAHALTQAKEFSLFIATAVTLFSYLLTGMFLWAIPWSELLSVKGILRSGWVLASYGRTESLLRLPRPGITYAAMYAVSLLAMRAFNKERTRDLVAAGVAGGLLAYVHFDVWTTIVGSYLILAVLETYWRGKWLHPVWIPGLIALVLSLPWLALNFPADPEKLRRIATFSHMPDAWSPVYLAAFVYGLYRFWEKSDGVRRWHTAVMGALFVMCNIQVLMGYSILRSHWYWFGNIYLILFGLMFVSDNWKKRPRLWLSGAGLLLLGVLAQNVVYAAIHFPNYARPRAVDEALAWLDREAERDCVVATLDSVITSVIPALTHCKVLVAYGDPIFSDITEAENQGRLHQAVGHYGMRWEDYLAGTGKIAGEFSNGGYFMAPFLLDAQKREVLLHSVPMDRTFAADYVWVSAAEREVFEGKPLPVEKGAPVFRNSRIAIYRVPR